MSQNSHFPHISHFPQNSHFIQSSHFWVILFVHGIPWTFSRHFYAPWLFVAKSKQAICCVAYCFYCHRIMRRFPSPTSWAPASGTMGITFSHDQNAVGVIILFSFLPLGDFCSTVNLPDKYHLGQVFPILPRASNLLDRSRSVLWYDKTIF